jgi:predicted unusual protein kinase regulating ubiquinone biosynthesis (AarF/ABC1/UbiB family)
VRNVAALMKLSGALPERLDLAPMLEEARRQLHDEADYEREGAKLTRFSALVADMPDFVTPELEPSLTTSDILAMSYLPGKPVETLADAPQAERDRRFSLISALVRRDSQS